MPPPVDFPRCADAKGDRDRLERELRDHKEGI